jgi:hypothetical protein
MEAEKNKTIPEKILVLAENFFKRVSQTFFFPGANTNNANDTPADAAVHGDDKARAPSTIESKKEIYTEHFYFL